MLIVNVQFDIINILNVIRYFPSHFRQQTFQAVSTSAH